MCHSRLYEVRTATGPTSARDQIILEPHMIRKSSTADFEEILHIINDAAIAYKGVIPADQWHEPYMTREELRTQIASGVRFSCYVDDGEIAGVMGIQERHGVDLIRHAYVRTKQRNKGIGTHLLLELISHSNKPVLIGTWKAAEWAINFYTKHGFSLVSDEEKNRLLKKYWSIPDRQAETSVVLADEKYRSFEQRTLE
jgi:N-acetylglutamate synthase-like GNAT family acetyltransferase